ncbi:hypothetical protein OSTOST_09807 [Ostertagia ostertagi]
MPLSAETIADASSRRRQSATLGETSKRAEIPERHNTTNPVRARAALRMRMPFQEEFAQNEVTDEENTCARLDGDEVCDRTCKKNDNNSSGRCQADGDQITCKCSPCETSMCDFEKDHECGWVDMHSLDKNYGNFSIASKQNQKNRYGLSRLAGRSYSGLFRRGSFRGPIALSVDVYPTEGIDVRICVENLQRCQTQKVTAKAWNRVKARIRVKEAKRVRF